MVAYLRINGIVPPSSEGRMQSVPARARRRSMMSSTTQNLLTCQKIAPQEAPPACRHKYSPEQTSASRLPDLHWRGPLAHLPLLFALFWTRGETRDLALAWTALGIALVLLGMAVRVWAQQHIQHRWRWPMLLTATGPYLNGSQPAVHRQHPGHSGGDSLCPGCCGCCRWRWSGALVIYYLWWWARGTRHRCQRGPMPLRRVSWLRCRAGCRAP